MTETSPQGKYPSALSPLRNLAAATMIFVMIGGVWQYIGAIEQANFVSIPSSFTDFREGRLTGSVEKLLDKNLPNRSDLIAFSNVVRYLTTGGAGDQVRAGRNGWLFLTDEIRFHESSRSNQQIRLQLVTQLSDQLETLGVKLVVALIPDKARVYDSQLVSGNYPDFNRTRYAHALTALEGKGVVVVDLLSPLKEAAAHHDVYYHSDTHWNQVGSRIAATAVANVVRPLIKQTESTTFATHPTGQPVERLGDLLRLMGLEKLPSPLRPAGDDEDTDVTSQTSQDSSSALFGDAPVPVVLTGTSYSLRGNFHGYLQQALSRKVLNAAKDGGGFLQATTAYLNNAAFQTSRPDILVWEIPERFLSPALDGENGWLSKLELPKH